MKLLFLSFYYEPDLCACTFRSKALVDALLPNLRNVEHIELLTTTPNRYSSFEQSAKIHETQGPLDIYRFPLPAHKSGFADQSKAFAAYAAAVLRHVALRRYDAVYATSSRLFTAVLGASIARTKRIPLYLDIRDIFTDTLDSILKGKALRAALPGFSLAERLTFAHADHINLVSEGFREYFARYTRPRYTFHSNGIDREFIGADFTKAAKKGAPLIITYAGNIGEGQGLEKFVPEAAKRLGPSYRFRIIGDGGRSKALVEALAASEVTNVEILPPVKRTELFSYYKDSDYLFLQLNNYAAFDNVLPSKLFEYGATGKPIIAGISGFARRFVEEHLPDALLYPPCDIAAFLQAFAHWKPRITSRNEFITRFQRSTIMNAMAADVLALARTGTRTGTGQ